MMRLKTDIPKPRPALKRSLSLFEATVYGVGIILGAGIYALIGEAAGIAGNAIWLSFVAAGFLASFTALSYAELSSVFPRSAAEFVYVRRAFNSKMLAFVIGYLTIITGIFSAATVSIGFANYFTSLFPLPAAPVAIALIAVVSAINFIGIKESARLNIILTAVEVGGLLLIILVGMRFLGTVDYFAIPSAAASPFTFLSVILTGSALIFFAYLGFEDVANTAEETINPRKTVPRALLLALFFTTAIYILVALVAVSVVPFAQLSESGAPLSLVAETALPGLGPLLALAALFSTFNTVLIMQIVTSRILYGISRENSLPAFLHKIHPHTRTPHFSIALTAAITILFALFSGIRQIAFLTDFGIFLIFFAVNASVIALRFRKPLAERAFRVPLSIGKLPILPLGGALFCLYMLFHFLEPVSAFGLELPIAAIGLLLTALSVPIYIIFNRRKKPQIGEISPSL